MNRSRRFLPVILSLAVAGCSGVVVQHHTGALGRHSLADFESAAGGGAIETVVVGNPFGGSKQAFDDRVRGLMKHRNLGIPADFVAGQSPRTDPLYKVVVAFDLPSAVPDHFLCRNPAGMPSRPRTGPLTIAIAFCRDEVVQSYATGHVDHVDGVDDPKFAALVRDATFEMVADSDYSGRS